MPGGNAPKGGGLCDCGRAIARFGSPRCYLCKVTRQQELAALPGNQLDRFLTKIRLEPSGCWLWLGSKNNQGYGWFGVNQKVMLAHRWSYQFFRGAIEDELVTDHLCRTRACVNPAHLEPVTYKENSRRGYWGSKTFCEHGHSYLPDNLYVRPNGDRECRECRRKQMREWKRNQRGVAAGVQV